jgi:hypothetical protein
MRISIHTGQAVFKTEPIGFEADKSYCIANAIKMDGVVDRNCAVHEVGFWCAPLYRRELASCEAICEPDRTNVERDRGR